MTFAAENSPGVWNNPTGAFKLRPFSEWVFRCWGFSFPRGLCCAAYRTNSDLLLHVWLVLQGKNVWPWLKKSGFQGTVGVFFKYLTCCSCLVCDNLTGRCGAMLVLDYMWCPILLDWLWFLPVEIFDFILWRWMKRVGAMARFQTYRCGFVLAHDASPFKELSPFWGEHYPRPFLQM